MKARYILLLMLPIILVACNKAPLTESTPVELSRTTLTKSGMEIDPKTLDSENFVSIEDVWAYTRFRALSAKNRGINLFVRQIDPIGPQEDVVLCYLINYNDGWEVISADKRTPVVLAEQDSGSLYLNEREDLAAPFIWINHLASDVLSVRSNPNYSADSPDAEEKIKASLQFWSAICDPASLMESRPGDLRTLPGDGNGGHWVLVNTLEEMIDYDQTILTNTTWHQESSYNSLCPVLLGSSGQHARAGSIAVAGAQMLYFLNTRSIPISVIPCQAEAYGDIINYFISFSGYSSANWGHIVDGNMTVIQILIAYIGQLLPNNWGQQETIASFSDLKTNVFAPLGFSCDLASYSSDLAKTSLQNNCPVVLYAQGHFSFLGIPTYTYKHAFLMDKIKRLRKRTIYNYQFLPDGATTPVPSTSYQEIILENPSYSNYVGMNWGWDPSTYNNTWYQATGSWTIDQYSYDDSRQMIYNFAQTNN